MSTRPTHLHGATAPTPDRDPGSNLVNSGGFSAHDTGLVMLQVAMGGEVISSSVVFEYKARDLPALPSSQHDWLSLDGEDKCFFKSGL